MPRHDRQIGHAPLLVLVVVLVGLGELDEVADSPRDDVLGALEPAVRALAGARVLLERARQDAREVLPDGRLLGDDEGLGHWRVSVAAEGAGAAGPGRPTARRARGRRAPPRPRGSGARSRWGPPSRPPAPPP